jgi:hypothetical protein
MGKVQRLNGYRFQMMYLANTDEAQDIVHSHVKIWVFFGDEYAHSTIVANIYRITKDLFSKRKYY